MIRHILFTSVGLALATPVWAATQSVIVGSLIAAEELGMKNEISIIAVGYSADRIAVAAARGNSHSRKSRLGHGKRSCHSLIRC